MMTYRGMILSVNKHEISLTYLYINIRKRGKKKPAGANVGGNIGYVESSVPSSSSGSSKKKRGKGKASVGIDDTENLLIPGRAECECQGI